MRRQFGAIRVDIVDLRVDIVDLPTVAPERAAVDQLEPISERVARRCNTPSMALSCPRSGVVVPASKKMRET
jgi:hypothetical protein